MTDPGPLRQIQVTAVLSYLQRCILGGGSFEPTNLARQQTHRLLKELASPPSCVSLSIVL